MPEASAQVFSEGLFEPSAPDVLLTLRGDSFPAWDILAATVLPALQAWLKTQLKPERFEHSLGVLETCLRLARGFGWCEPRVTEAGLAGLLHDVAKHWPLEKLLAFCSHYGVELTDWDRQTPQTMHPIAGAAWLEHVGQLKHPAILSAIRSHTTAKSQMSQLDWLVYVADKIESRTRSANYVAEMTLDLDETDEASLLKTARRILDRTLQDLILRQQPIHPNTLAARNALLFTLKKEA